jgi:hypothetical protein
MDFSELGMRHKGQLGTQAQINLLELMFMELRMMTHNFGQ